MTREQRPGGQLNLGIAFLDEAYHAEPGEGLRRLKLERPFFNGKTSSRTFPARCREADLREDDRLFRIA